MMEIKIGDKVSYTWAHLTMVETVLKIRGLNENMEIKITNLAGWLPITTPTLKIIPQ